MFDPLDQKVYGQGEKLPDHVQIPEPMESSQTQPSCPVCRKPVPLPIPELCPNCQAPIEPILAIIEVAELSLSEALRDLRIGNPKSVARRLTQAKVSSEADRLRAEVIQAMLDRLNGDPSASLARLRAVQDELTEPDPEVQELILRAEEQALRDQASLAACCELHNFALFQAKRGHYEEAREAARKALEQVPHHAPTRALLGKIQLALGEEDDARYQLERSIALEPDNPAVSRILARIGKRNQANPFAALVENREIFFRWAGPVFIVLVLLFIALAALLNR